MLINHPAGNVAEAIIQMQKGNAKGSEQRNLSIVKHPVLIGRKYPAALSHWTSNELETYLLSTHWPANTLKGHESSRRVQITDALKSGKWVPQVVMDEAEGQDALEDAIMWVKAEASWSIALANHKSNVSQFEMVMSYCSSKDDFEQKIESLIVSACTKATLLRVNTLSEAAQTGLYFDGSGIPGFNKLTLTMLSTERTQRKMTHLSIRDGTYPDVSVWGELMRISVDKVESYLRTLMKSGALTLAQCRLLMGSFWTPYVVVTEVSPIA